MIKPHYTLHKHKNKIIAFRIIICRDPTILSPNPFIASNFQYLQKDKIVGIGFGFPYYLWFHFQAIEDEMPLSVPVGHNMKA